MRISSINYSFLRHVDIAALLPVVNPWTRVHARTVGLMYWTTSTRWVESQKISPISVSLLSPYIRNQAKYINSEKENGSVH